MQHNTTATTVGVVLCCMMGLCYPCETHRSGCGVVVHTSYESVEHSRGLGETSLNTSNHQPESELRATRQSHTDPTWERGFPLVIIA